MLPESDIQDAIKNKNPMVFYLGGYGQIIEIPRLPIVRGGHVIPGNVKRPDGKIVYVEEFAE